MKHLILNPFEMSDWGGKRFFITILAIHLFLGGIIGLDYIGIHFPLARQVIGVGYLMFVPGLTFLRMLKLHNLGGPRTVLYSLGLSTAFLMLTGYIINNIYPHLGLARPLSESIIILTIGVSVFLLNVLYYLCERDMTWNSNRINLHSLVFLKVLGILLLPLITIIGTQCVNLGQNNVILMGVIVIISIIYLFIGFGDKIPKDLYPLLIWSIAISVLLHRTLISNYIHMYDVYGEYFVASSVIRNQLWDPLSVQYAQYETVISVTLLPSIFHYFCDIDLTWIYKIIFPFYLSLIPVGLFMIYTRYFDQKLSFFAVILTVSFFKFFTEIPFVSKQIIAQYFFVMLLLLIFSAHLPSAQLRLLIILFGCSIIVSHYGIAVLTLFMLFCYVIIHYLNILQMLNKFICKSCGRLDES